MINCGGWEYRMRNARWYWNNPVQWSRRRRRGEE